MRFLARWFLTLRWTGRRALVAAAFVLLVPPLLLSAWGGLLLDELVHRRYRRTRVAAPIFVTGNPRSGTTFLHRLLALDLARFSTMRMWQILFAPSIVQRRAAGALAAADRRMGSRLARRWRQVEARWAGLNPMHRVSLFAPEEDDYLLLHAWSALTIGLSAGLLDEARRYTYFDSALPAGRRTRIMRFYRRCVQRHLYAEAGRRRGAPRPLRYLAKNPALCPKLDSVLAEFPDARIVYLVRNPLETIPSYVSMMEFSWRAAGVRGDPAMLREHVLEMAIHWYRYPLERLARLPPDRCAIVRYDDLVRDPSGTVLGLYARFGLEADEPFRKALAAEAARARRFRSRHRYSLERLGLSRERIVADLADVFERFGFPCDSDAGGAHCAEDTTGGWRWDRYEPSHSHLHSL